MSHTFERLSICGVPVDHVNVEQLMNAFVDWSADGHPQRHVCYLNAHVHNLARRDEQLRRVLQQSAICYADGASIAWASRLLGGDIPGRLTGADFFPTLMGRLTEGRRRVYFLGGKPGVAEKTANALAKEVPDFAPVGITNGYFDSAESANIVEAINQAHPDVLIVGMGSPRQEKWIAENQNALDVPLIWAVGALLDYRAGEERRCPRWMGDHGLEWLFRLAMNPRRMAGRYLLGNPQFVFSVVRSKLMGKLAT